MKRLLFIEHQNSINIFGFKLGNCLVFEILATTCLIEDSNKNNGENSMNEDEYTKNKKEHYCTF